MKDKLKRGVDIVLSFVRDVDFTVHHKRGTGYVMKETVRVFRLPLTVKVHIVKDIAVK